MNRRDTASLAFVMAGIYLLVEASQILTGIGYLVTGLVGGVLEGDLRWSPVTLTGLVPLIPFAVMAVAGSLLIVRRNRLAERLFPGDVDPVQPPARPGELQAVAFSVVGVVFFSHSLWRLVSYCSSLAIRAQMSDEQFKVENWPHLITMIVGLIIGLVLFFGATSLARFWHWCRYAGIRRGPAEPE